jgi:hypothetical protein
MRMRSSPSVIAQRGENRSLTRAAGMNADPPEVLLVDSRRQYLQIILP